MIEVTIFKHHSDALKITISGHANSGDYGKDLVCAGASAIFVGTLNALNQKGIEFNWKMESGDSMLELITINDSSLLIVETCIIQLQTMQESYSKYIRIRNKEV